MSALLSYMLMMVAMTYDLTFICSILVGLLVGMRDQRAHMRIISCGCDSFARVKLRQGDSLSRAPASPCCFASPCAPALGFALRSHASLFLRRLVSSMCRVLALELGLVRGPGRPREPVGRASHALRRPGRCTRRPDMHSIGGRGAGIFHLQRKHSAVGFDSQAGVLCRLEKATCILEPSSARGRRLYRSARTIRYRPA